MPPDPHDRQTAALHRLLREATQGGQAKVDALLALMQRTVFVVPWPGGEGYRTLVNSTGVAALPIFTERSQLEMAARRYGWLAPDGSVPAVEVGSRQALHYARTQSLAFVVVDIAAEHGVEVTREEFEPLLSPAARRESSGPFAGAGKISSTLMSAVRPKSTPPPPTDSMRGAIRAPTPPPGSIPAVRPASRPGAIDAPRPASSPSVGRPPSGPGTIPAVPPPPGSGQTPGSERGIATPGIRRPASTSALPRVGPAPTIAGSVVASAKLGPPPATPSDELLEKLEALFRDYPEIEWACLGSMGASPALGLRVDPRVRQRVEEIAGRAASAIGQPIATVLLDEPGHLRAARADALVFYPWRRR